MKPKHGANLFELSQKYGFNIEEIVDFSSNINPFGVSKKALEKLKNNLDKAAIYPDPDYIELKKIIANYLDTSNNQVLIASGVSSFIKSFISILNPKNSLIYSPTYSEYEKELSANNSKIHKYNLVKKENFNLDIDKLIEKINSENIELTFICNPNNPTGTIIEKEKIEKILKSINSILIVDETYVEFSDTDRFSSVNLATKYDNLVVMRSTSKFFSTPGIRLGYSVTNNEKILEIYNNKEELIWGINIYAEIMGKEMFQDYEYQTKVRNFIEEERKNIYKELSDVKSLKLYKSYGNFILIEIVDKSITSDELYDLLIQKKMAIRNCRNFENLNEYFFRICILSKENNEKLILGIRKIMLGDK